jgi:hypothetical protein
LQVAENKELGPEKERQKIARGGKPLKTEAFLRGSAEGRTPKGVRTLHPGGNADVYQKTGVAGKAIRNTMKTKG